MTALSTLTPFRKRVIVALMAAAVFSATSSVYLYQKFDVGDAIAQRWEVEVGHSEAPFMVARLEEAFASIDYDITRIREGRGVPRVLVRTIPEDLGQVPEVERRKDLFIGSVLPLVLAVNEQILTERTKIEAISKKLKFQETLTDDDVSELERLGKIYEVIEDSPEDEAPAVDMATISPADLVDELLLRVAPLPVSLVIAQAARGKRLGLVALCR